MSQMNRQIDYKTMRALVGAIALLLAPAVYLLSDWDRQLTSISISYWTNSGDIFVGSLIAVGFFLFAYNGTGNGKRDLEFWLSKAACGFAIIVAWFPTDGFDAADVPPTWTTRVSQLVRMKPEELHYIAAILQFACLIVMMWFFSNRARQKRSFARAATYRTLCILMVAGGIAILTLGKLSGLSTTVLLVETWELTLFGFGWLLAGTYKTQPAPALEPRPVPVGSGERL
jgi:hypothetical protein